MKILVIEDNESVSSMIEMFFAKEDIEGAFVTDGLEGYQFARNQEWDCLIIDWMLPGMDGMAICRKLRQEKRTVPIIMLTAKDSESDQVLGLEMGADDYVTKPFSPLALMARIKAVTRRYQQQAPVSDAHIIRTARLSINKDTREVLLDGRPVTSLTPKEFDLLYHFAQHPKQVFTRDQLLEKVWGYQFYGDDRTVDVHIKRLRSKIGSADHPFLHTVWGVGYKFDEGSGAAEVPSAKEDGELRESGMGARVNGAESRVSDQQSRESGPESRVSDQQSRESGQQSRISMLQRQDAGRRTLQNNESVINSEQSVINSPHPRSDENTGQNSADKVQNNVPNKVQNKVHMLSDNQQRQGSRHPEPPHGRGK